MNQLAIDLERRAAELLPPTSKLPKPLDRACQILAHYRWSQLARRGWRRINRQFSGNRLISVQPLPGRVKVRDIYAPLDALSRIYVRGRSDSSVNQVRDLADGSIVLLNERREMGVPLDWAFARTPPATQLWRFQLHYHEFLLEQAASVPSTEVAQRVWQTIDSWIDAYDLGQVRREDDAWHPYCISRRLPVWIWLWHRLEHPANMERILNCFFSQATYLASNLEFDPGGNHLLENLTALGLAASFLDHGNCAHWLDLVQRELSSELNRQILEHGEHFERTPMYHRHVQANLLTLAVATTTVRPELTRICAEYAARMAGFGIEIAHPDGEIPLFGDSGFGEGLGNAAVAELASLAGISTTIAGCGTRTIGPYWVHRDKESAIIFDGGPVGPSELPAHAHCDLLGFEASIGGRRWFVDSGNYNYEADSMRRYCRSTLAHNAVVVDGREQCDTWSKFRMGRRGQPSRFRSGQRAGAEWVSARHDAYRSGGGGFLDRVLVAWGEAWACGDFLHTRSRFKLEGFLHLAEGLSIEQLGEREFELSDQRHRRRISFFGVDKVQLGEAWVCPSFGQRIRQRCFAYSQTRGPNTGLGWLLDGVDSKSSVELDGPKLYLRVALATFEWSFQ